MGCDNYNFQLREFSTSRPENRAEIVPAQNIQKSNIRASKSEDQHGGLDARYFLLFFETIN